MLRSPKKEVQAMSLRLRLGTFQHPWINRRRNRVTRPDRQS